MSSVLQDIRLSLRGFAKRPGYMAALVGTLALGIGASTAMFSLVDAALLKRLPFEDPDRLVAIWGVAGPERNPRGASLSAEVGPNDLVNLSCLRGVCGFGSILIPERYVLADAANNEDPQPMSFADLTAWGENVPEATEIAQIAFSSFGPSIAAIPIASSRAGKLNSTSNSRPIRVSVQPP